MDTKEQPYVVIIGGGFSGLNVAKGLKDAPVNVVLVDKQNYHLFQPLLYQVATAALSDNKIAAPIRKVLRKQKNTKVGLAQIERADLEQKMVYGQRVGVQYDYLVLAMGVEQAYFGHDEFKPYAPGLKSLDDAHEIRRRILLAFEEAEYEGDAAARRGKLTFVVVGGGPTGVELAGAIMETATQTLPSEFRNIDTKTARVILVDGGERLLKAFPESMGIRAQRDLEEMGVEIWFNRYVTGVDERGVMIGEEHVAAENVLWAAGIQGTKIAASLGVDLDPIGRIKVGPDLSVPGYPEVFVVGDAAHVINEGSGEPVPGVAQGAIQMGEHVARTIKDEVTGGNQGKRHPFRYHDKGSMATIGRGKAIAWVGGRTVGGFLGWLMWSLVHVMFLVGFQTKFMVILDWAWNYLLHERGARIITGDPKLQVKEVRGIRSVDVDER